MEEKKKRGRPKKASAKKQCTIMIAPDLHDKAKKYAEEEMETSFSSLLALLLKEFLKDK